MPWAPGESGNPNGYQGPRNQSARHKIHREIMEEIKGLGHKDALLVLSTIANDEKADTAYRVGAATALAPFQHPKLQSIPTPRFIELQIDVPDFTCVADAETFVARILSLVAKGHLDIQSGQELIGLAKVYIAVYQDQTFSMSLRVRAASGLVWSQYAKNVLHTPSTSLFIPEGYSAELMARYPWSQDPGSPNGKSQSFSDFGQYNAQASSESPNPIDIETTPSSPNFEKFLYTVFYTSPLLRRLLTPEYHSSSADFRRYQ